MTEEISSIDIEQRICEHYLALVEKAQQLFAGLRDLPMFGKQWEPYFQRTFEIYTQVYILSLFNMNISQLSLFQISNSFFAYCVLHSSSVYFRFEITMLYILFN
jgi:hypothetical protein